MRSCNVKKFFLVLTAALLLTHVGCQPEDEIEISFSGMSSTIVVGTDMTVTAETSEPVQSYQWFLNGALLRDKNSDSITIGSKLTPGDYQLELLVKKDNKTGKDRLRFNVILETAGIAKWASAGIAGDSYFLNTATAADGSIYCVGCVSGSADFGNDVTVTAGSSRQSILLVKYNGKGTAMWAKTIANGSAMSLFYSVSTASDGSVYAAGLIYGISSYDFGDGVTATGVDSMENMLLVKYDGHGKAKWAKTMVSGSDSSSISAVSVSPDGSIYVAGSISGNDPFDLGDGVTATVEGYAPTSILLVKYDGAGTAKWARTVAKGYDESIFFSVSVARDGSIYAAGHISPLASFDFGNGVIVSPPGFTEDYLILLVKYDSDGNALWGKTISNVSGYSEFYAVSAASDGSVYAAGFTWGTGSFDFGDGVTVTGANSNETSVIVKYDHTGVAKWAKTVTTENTDAMSYFVRMTAARDNTVYVIGLAGNIDGSGIDFGNGVTLTGVEPYGTSFLIKYDGAGAAQWVQTAIPGDDMLMFQFSGVSVAPDGSVYMAGSAYGSLDFGNNVTVTDSMGGLLVKYR